MKPRFFQNRLPAHFTILLTLGLCPWALPLPAGVSISVKREIVNPKPVGLAPGDEIAAVTGSSSGSSAGYVLEDLERHREGGVSLALNRQLTNAHFKCFWWDGLGLCRSFLFVAHTGLGAGPEGRPSLTPRLVKATISTLSNLPSPEAFTLARVTLAPTESIHTNPPGEALGPRLDHLKRRLLEIKSDLERTDTRELRRDRESRVAPLIWPPQTWETNRSPWGLGSLECLGGLGHPLVYRMRLAHSDTELARRESSVAHAYFAYVLEGPGNSLSVILTTAAFSVWIK